MDKYSQFLFEETSPEHDSKVLNAARGLLSEKKQPLAHQFTLRWLAAAFGVVGIFFVSRTVMKTKSIEEQIEKSDFSDFAFEFSAIQEDSIEVVELLEEEDFDLLENLDLLEEMENV